MTRLEQLARAMCRACGDDPDAIGYVPHSLYPVMDHAFPRWQSYTGAVERFISALREPTDDMIQAGDDAMDWDSSDVNCSYYVHYRDGDAAKSWRAMIDYVLKEAEESKL